MTYDAADGYVVLFGGLVGQAGPFCGPNNCKEFWNCSNETWIFSHGVWTNLSIPGPPATCDLAMAYDARDGYILAYLWYGSEIDYWWYGTGWGTGGSLNQTWEFRHGVWTQLEVPPPDVALGAVATYDSNSGSVLLYASTEDAAGFVNYGTWEFSAGLWVKLHPLTTPQIQYPSGLTYDSADGYAILLADSTTGINGSTTCGTCGNNVTWAFSGGDWTSVSSLPFSISYGDLLGGLAFDQKDGYAVFGGYNATWLYSGGVWTNASIPGPPPWTGVAMTFDSADGYLLRFGGCGDGKSDNITSCLHDDTWIYTAPPVGVRLSVSAVPSPICSRMSEDCGAETDQTRVSIGVAAAPVTGNESWGVDSGKGLVEYGPYYWVDLPTLTFVGWKNLTPAPDLSPSVSCGLGSGSPPSCGLRPSVVTLASGAEQLTWNWSNSSLSDALRVGDWWNLSFNVKALGPPFATVPVDSCTTAACTAVKDGPVDGVFASLGFTPWGNESRLADSLPLATVTVLPPLTQNSPPPGTSPPPPPPAPVAAPLPVTLPVPPTVVTAPTPVAVTAGSAGSGTSLTAVAAGLLGAGLTRVAVSRKSQAMRIANQVRMPNGGRRHPIRGND